jgi:hypothetical protein
MMFSAAATPPPARVTRKLRLLAVNAGLPKDVAGSGEPGGVTAQARRN